MERGGSGMSNMESVTNKENEVDNSVHQRWRVEEIGDGDDNG